MLSAICGGVLIGLSASLFWSLNGRVAGVSGILGGALRDKGPERHVRVAFLLGLLLAGIAFAAFSERIASPSLPLVPLAGAGLLVGFGTRMSGGCTWSRGLWAQPFLAALARRRAHVHGHRCGHRVRRAPRAPAVGAIVKPLFSALLAGLVFGVGLCVSGMTDPKNIIAFLDVAGHWSPNLAGVMLGAITVHAAWLRWGTRRVAACANPSLPPRARIDAALLGGAALFGIGWGLSGYCPGPSIVALGSGALAPLVFASAMLVGVIASEALKSASVRVQHDPNALFTSKRN